MSSKKDTSLNDLLGKIFYAAAHADDVIKEEEIARMNELLHEHWSDELDQIVKSFYTCVNLSYDHNNVYAEVDAFKEIYPEVMDKQKIETIMKTCYKIVYSFAATNKSEVIFLSKLRSTLEK